MSLRVVGCWWWWCQADLDASDLYCRHSSKQCLLGALTSANVRKIPCEQILKSLDILAASVLDCSARAALYDCARTNLTYVFFMWVV